MRMMNMVDWIIKDNCFHHACYWIDAHLEWVIELEPENYNLQLRIYSLLLFGKTNPSSQKPCMSRLRAKYTLSRVSLAEY